MDTFQSSGSNAVLTMKQYIETNYDADLSFSKVARGYFFNEGYLRRVFRQATGESFSSFLNEIRINAAKRLLAETNWNILDVSMQVGFHNVTYFNRVFKQKAGMTPRRYREQMTGKRG